MKAPPVLILMLLLTTPLLFVVPRCGAIEGGPPPPPVKKSNPVEGGTKIVKTDAEKKEKEIKGDVKKDGPKDRPGEMKDKTSETKAEESKGKGESGGGSNLKTGHVEDSGVEECDPSNRCIDEKNKFVACLRVPGKDSLDLSLLIQNKGTGPLNVNIVAPTFVKLERGTVQLQSKENKEVKVSVQDGANDTMIVLKAGEGNCSLSFRNFISETVRSETSTFFGYTRPSTRSSLIGGFLAAAMLVCLALLCMKCRRMSFEGGSRYQKVEMGLPVSSGGKKEADEEADGWDGGWGDSWDEEEAPMTPSRPVSNPSSKGLASRKSTKDGWKD